MALYSDAFGRAQRTEVKKGIVRVESRKMKMAKETASAYFAQKMLLLPDDVRPRHAIITPRDASLFVKHFITPDLVDHLDSSLMKRAVAYAARFDPKITENVRAAQGLARDQEYDAIAESRQLLKGRVREPYVGPMIKNDQEKVIAELIANGHTDVITRSAPLSRVLKRAKNEGLAKAHFRREATRQDPSKIAQALLESRNNRPSEQTLAA